jgi:putative Mg2+ transporter-C (MgtC) family protein
VIRTLDPHVPNVVRYQTALHSVTSGASIEQAFRFDKRKISKKFALLGKVPEGREIFVPGMWMVGTGARFLRLRAMEQIIADLFPRTAVPYPVLLARLTGAILLGAVIGAEREYRAHAAGLRTHILVALAACVFAILSIESVHMAGFSDDQVRIDPLRVIEAVTSGVAFLAAGMIVFSRGEVPVPSGFRLASATGSWRSLRPLRVSSFSSFSPRSRLAAMRRTSRHGTRKRDRSGYVLIISSEFC